MDGYTYGEDQPTRKCPYCGARCEADFVDIGVGYTQCGPYHCDQCLASEIGPYDAPRDLTDAEKTTGWYLPGHEPGSSANVIAGRVVSHRAMRETYAEAWTHNPEYDTPGAVEQWWQDIRSTRGPGAAN